MTFVIQHSQHVNECLISNYNTLVLLSYKYTYYLNITHILIIILDEIFLCDNASSEYRHCGKDGIETVLYIDKVE